MLVVNKYTINKCETLLRVPSGSYTLRAGLQNDKVVIWIKVDTDKEMIIKTSDYIIQVSLCLIYLKHI